MDAALDFNDAVAAELRRQRAARGLTIDEVARRAGMVRTTVLRYLNGKRAIPIGALYGLSGALSVEAHRVVAAAEASCAAASAAEGLPAVGTTDSMEPKVRPGLLIRVRSQVGTSTRDHALIAPTLAARSPAGVGTGRGDIPDHVGLESAPARVAVSGDTMRHLGPHRGAPSAAQNLIA
ncbi:helix-turn-helix transcriptional regulator [Plantibacter sp. VKM Ac-2885]|uniref:helix-turn-helix domain-containing protein n=1 Tax=Plantibacter sp. VKM Ac-2885 TaxID=2783828 RepID=UPI00188A153E|nr:helix-turn-helix transcriptional regulator [Plantibacter sp. VKM Ac-2885]